MSVKAISIHGVTGSIGQSTVDVIMSAPERFNVQMVSAHSRVVELADIARKIGAKVAVIEDESKFSALSDALQGSGVQAYAGRSALIEKAAIPVDITMAAIVGMAGLEPLMAAIPHSKVAAIANKEPLVAAGDFVLKAANDAGCKILPVDSEHNAVFQVFEEQNRSAITRLILTASGGPFREWTLKQMATATPEQAVAHPNWCMGAKISVDSASMMNKALEVIEAHVLFNMPADQIDVIIHPQSIIHSMVEYNDGSILSQMGASDMRTPIAYALSWPDRMPTPGKRLDLHALSKLEFSTPDHDRFPAIPLAYQAIKSGLAARIALNAANEIAVSAFLKQKIGFLDIAKAINSVLDSLDAPTPVSVNDAIELDEICRRQAAFYIDKIIN
ncbi:MAG: 1-deoxy-D-xylulose-5-phosphate reductoisomerase [Micavibrio sp.]|nr:1-deoxy-D-xylulose-5-phosphate reductoisomerase [Micavibrio sp.]